MPRIIHIDGTKAPLPKLFDDTRFAGRRHPGKQDPGDFHSVFIFFPDKIEEHSQNFCSG
jgi:hypothetical protein